MGWRVTRWMVCLSVCLSVYLSLVMGRVIMHRPGGIDNFGYMMVVDDDVVFREEKRDILDSCQLEVFGYCWVGAYLKVAGWPIAVCWMSAPFVSYVGCVVSVWIRLGGWGMGGNDNKK
ncbi:MAG: hypothetical protein BYD32DRAFT_434149 [Podila humilis]|nr:MAG: hypothetical protein BYD32DRAFT_434149 [Podila humilis]